MGRSLSFEAKTVSWILNFYNSDFCPPPPVLVSKTPSVCIVLLSWSEFSCKVDRVVVLCIEYSSLDNILRTLASWIYVITLHGSYTEKSKDRAEAISFLKVRLDTSTTRLRTYTCHVTEHETQSARTLQPCLTKTRFTFYILAHLIFFFLFASNSGVQSRP